MRTSLEMVVGFLLNLRLISLKERLSFRHFCSSSLSSYVKNLDIYPPFPPPTYLGYMILELRKIKDWFITNLFVSQDATFWSYTINQKHRLIWIGLNPAILAKTYVTPW